MLNFIFAIVITFLVSYIIRQLRATEDLPPAAPKHIPLLGNLLSVDAKNVHKQFTKWGKKLGPIFRLDANQGVNQIVVTSFEFVKQVLLTEGEKFGLRPGSTSVLWKVGDCRNHCGLIDAMGDRWSDLRHGCASFFKKLFEDQSKILDQKIITQWDKLNDWITDNINPSGSTIMDPDRPLKFCVGNILSSILMGQDFILGDRDFQKMIKQLKEVQTLAHSEGLTLAQNFPILQLCPGDPFMFKKYETLNEELINYFQSLVEIEEKSFDRENAQPTCLIQALLKQAAEAGKASRKKHFNKHQIVGVIADMWLAGFDPTVSALRWLILLLAKYPEMQEKIYAETESVAGLDCSTSLDCQSRMVYTQAFISEMFRFSSIIGRTPFHMSEEETEIGGFTIPPKTSVLPMIYSVHHDPEIFPDPEIFEPDRFLEENRDGPPKIPEQLIPFGMGPRSCVGESLAKGIIFSLLINLVRRYQIALDETRPEPSLEPVNDLTLTPASYRVLLKVRNFTVKQ